MTPHDVGKMLTFALIYDGRRPPLDDRGTEALAWHRVFVAARIGDSPYEDLEQAVVDHYASTGDYLTPHHIVTPVKRYRLARLKAAGDLHRFVTADPDDAPACHAEYQRLCSEVAAGRRSPAQLERAS
jgi:hypothetical protein